MKNARISARTPFGARSESRAGKTPFGARGESRADNTPHKIRRRADFFRRSRLHLSRQLYIIFVYCNRVTPLPFEL